MGHDHAHQVVEENPKVTSKAALLFVLIIIGLVVGLFNFVQSMSHTEGHHGEATAHADEKEHTSWSKHTNLQYDATALAGDKAPKATTPAASLLPVTNVDSTTATAPVKDSTKATK